MSNVKRAVVGMLCVILLVCSFIAFTGFTSANAETSEYFSAEEYTNSDKLLNYDGTSSENETIFTFADEVHYSEMAAFIPDLSRVVPLQYLENDGTYSYFGKEYGFYMVVEEPYTDLLLVDISYELEDGKLYGEHNKDNVYTIKIQPILQQSFYTRNSEAGGLTWQKYSTANRPVYYIMNPRFITSIRNENALNQGDPNYSKQTDEGIIIQQTMVQYQNILQQDDIDLSITSDFIASMSLDAIVDFLDATIFHDCLGFMKSMIDYAGGHYDSKQEESFLTGETISIFTEQAKETQKDDNSMDGYSRTTYFYPEEEIILSEYEDSYAEFSVLASDADYRTRLSQICEFDIARSMGHMGIPQYFAGNWNGSDDEAFSFYNTKVLFDNKEPEFAIDNNNIEGATIPVYVLPEGQQKIVFEAVYSAYYCFESEADVGIEVFENADKVTDEQGDYYLQAGKTYLIVLSSNSNEKIISDLAVGIAERVPDKPASANEKLILKISVQQADAYNLSTGSPNVLIENILTAGAGGLAPYDMFKGYIAADEISLPMQDGDYFVVVRFTESSDDDDYEIEMTACEEKSLGQTVTINADGINYRYVKFEGVAEGKYVVASDCDDEITYRIYDGYLEDVAFSGANNCGSFNIDGNTIFVGILADSDASFVLNPVGVAYEWRVSGNKVNINGDPKLEIGKTYKIELFVNDIKQDGRYIQSDNNEYCKISYENGDAWLKISGMSDLGLAFTLDYQVGEVRPFDCDLELLTKYTLTFKGIKDIVNGETIELEWVHSEDLTEIEYSIEKADRNGKISVKNYTIIPVSGAATGATYSKDITKDVEEMNDYLSDATIRINKIGVQMPEGVRYFEMSEPGANFYKKISCFYGGGSGAEDDPFTISCKRHFSNMGLNNNNETHFVLTTGIRLSGKPIEDFYGVLTTSNAPYGSMSVIYSLSKAAGDSLDGYGGYGIFVNNYGTISNIQARVDFTVTGKNNTRSFYSGGIVAYNYGTINNCSAVSSSISTQFFNGAIGGIAGRNSGTIEDCWASIEITSYSNMGGIAGENIGTIKDCSIMGNLNHTVYVYNGTIMSACIGGIVGDNQKGGIVTGCVLGSEDDATLYIKNCNEIDLNLWKGPYMGPVYGRNNGKITDCMSYHYELDKGGLVMFSQIVNINYDIP